MVLVRHTLRVQPGSPQQPLLGQQAGALLQQVVLVLQQATFVLQQSLLR
jgi:hypothetical protein